MKLLQWLFPEKRAKLVAAEQALTDLDNLSGVGPLAEALWLGDRKIQKQAELALIRMLPCLSFSDTKLLTTWQWHCLYRALNGKNDSLKIAIIRSLENVGAETELFFVLPIVERLAEESSTAMSGQRVAQAAQECLPYLRPRVQFQTQTLLRASDRPCVPMNALRQPNQEKEKV